MPKIPGVNHLRAVQGFEKAGVCTNLYGGSLRAAKTRVRLGKPGTWINSFVRRKQRPHALLRSQRPYCHAGCQFSIKSQ